MVLKATNGSNWKNKSSFVTCMIVQSGATPTKMFLKKCGKNRNLESPV
jgi:hypothetical protein